MKIPTLQRYCPSGVLIYSVIFVSMLAWIFGSRSHHDGRTVTLMLARFGEGPLGKTNKFDVGEEDCEEGLCKQHRTKNKTNSSHVYVEDLCWGYEKDCKKENRLFVPQCQGPPEPWYDVTALDPVVLRKMQRSLSSLHDVIVTLFCPMLYILSWYIRLSS